MLEGLDRSGASGAPCSFPVCVCACACVRGACARVSVCVCLGVLCARQCVSLERMIARTPAAPPGKSTQVKMLVESLERAGHRAKVRPARSARAAARIEHSRLKKSPSD